MSSVDTHSHLQFQNKLDGRKHLKHRKKCRKTVKMSLQIKWK